jgi:hypothetical protein
MRVVLKTKSTKRKNDTNYELEIGRDFLKILYKEMYYLIYVKKIMNI